MQKHKRHMSIDQFLEELLKTPRLWGLNSEGRLIFDSDDVCPISAVAGLVLDGEPASEAFDYQSADRLGLSHSNAAKIISAADNDSIGGGHLKRKNIGELRKRLLVACGLLDDESEDEDDIVEDE